MKRARIVSGDQLALLDWQPPQTVARFQDDQVRAVSISDRLCRGISVALREAPYNRDQVATRMSEFLGQPVSVNMLDAYASQARGQHNISAVRLVALLHATQDRRLLELVAEMFGWPVIERKFLKLIELASLQEREDALRRQRETLRREARSEGLI